MSNTAISQYHLAAKRIHNKLRGTDDWELRPHSCWPDNTSRAGSILNKRVSKLVVIVHSTIAAIHLSNHAVLLHNPPITTLGIGAHELDLFAGIDNHEVGGPS